MHFLPKLHLHCCHISLNNREIFPLMDNGGCFPNENFQRQTAMCLYLLTEVKQSYLATGKWLWSSHIQMYLSVINLFGFWFVVVCFGFFSCQYHIYSSVCSRALNYFPLGVGHLHGSSEPCYWVEHAWFKTGCFYQELGIWNFQLFRRFLHHIMFSNIILENLIFYLVSCR